jgi:dTDP-4-amino-4,6-dideoxygalactose transaminase
MTDIMAAIGLVELRRYESFTLPRRKEIFDAYKNALSKYAWAEIAPYETDSKTSSYHLFPLRIRGISEVQRDAIMQKIFDQDVSVNVHFIPVPMMSFYKEQGYSIANYPVTYYNFSREISLPVYIDLTNEQVQIVINAVVSAVESILTNQHA